MHTVKIRIVIIAIFSFLFVLSSEANAGKGGLGALIRKLDVPKVPPSARHPAITDAREEDLGTQCDEMATHECTSSNQPSANLSHSTTALGESIAKSLREKKEDPNPGTNLLTKPIPTWDDVINGKKAP